MLLLGVIAFSINWAMAWSIVRGQSGAIPFAMMIAATTGITFAFGIIISVVMVKFGSSVHSAANEALDVAVYFGLPAAAWAAYCAAIKNRMETNSRRATR